VADNLLLVGYGLLRGSAKRSARSPGLPRIRHAMANDCCHSFRQLLRRIALDIEAIRSG
jgi:hypothetical protein